MWKKFFKFLLWVLIISLISGVVVTASLLLGKDLAFAGITLAVIFGTWFLVVIIRKIIIRYRARAQVRSVIQQGRAEEINDLGMTPAELITSLKGRWKGTIKALKKSQLRYQGDPLYVLPWYIIFGRPTSGKSTALRSSKLLSPSIDLSEHEDGSTLNLEWWLYEEAIVIDTAGRYAVPDSPERDRKEWDKLLGLIARHKQKEPLNGLVLVIAANRLLECSEEELLEEGRQVRASINSLMDKLEVKVPVYLMVTKCDLVDGFCEWSEYLPEESRQQAMGYLNESQNTDIDSNIDVALDSVLDRMKELRLLMMERSDNPDDSLLDLPVNMEKLRHGLHVFSATALKGNVYQEAPQFRGLYFSSSRKEESKDHSQGLFLHQFFTKVLPADRGALISLPSAERLRRAISKYAFGVGGALTFIAIASLFLTFNEDLSGLERIAENYNEVILDKNAPMNQRIVSAYRLTEIIRDLKVAESNRSVPWFFWMNGSDHIHRLENKYVDFFSTAILAELDKPLNHLIQELPVEDTSDLAGGLIRRINLLKTTIKYEGEGYADLSSKPIILKEYVLVQNETVDREAAEVFHSLYLSYLEWQTSKLVLSEEVAYLQNSLVDVIRRNHGNYDWITDWANSQGFSGVKLSDFWGGSRKVVDSPHIEAAYTIKGSEFITTFLVELQEANDGESQLSDIKEDFEQYYQREYIKAWTDFAERFQEGRQRFRDAKEWKIAIQRMGTNDSPFFAFMERMFQELKPYEAMGYNSSIELAFFHEMQQYSGPAGKAKDNTKAAKMGLKLISKLGKAGKVVAKVGKKGLKAKKKAKKLGLGKSAEELDEVLDDAVKALDEYKLALVDAAFKSDSRSQSFSSISTLFSTPDTLESTDGAVGSAWSAILKQQSLIGKPLPGSEIFWDLYMGAMDIVYDYMQMEASCELQTRWEDEVLASAEGVSKNKLGNLVVGEGGLLWAYLDSSAKPFLSKQYRKGYVRMNSEGRTLTMTEEFIDILNRAAEGRYVVGSEFQVDLKALPTGVNQSAAISPYATFLDLHCADGVQTLANYNYPASFQFKWSLETCGDTSLRIEIGQLRLTKHYKGVKGFNKFLADFQDGRRIFLSEEFPNKQAQLENEGVQAIDISYEISGQEPLIRMIESVPLELPREAAYCW